ncbi:MAG: LPS export ABC transporter permease LptG [Aestuariivita sp.]|nr:LPS export ABC transporter permease LptG [Aestuariivita sp.]
MTLHIYFAKKFFQSFIIVLSVLLIFLLLIDLVEQSRKFRNNDVYFSEIFQIILLNLPIQISEMLPLIIILATIALFITLARSNELVITRSAGRSGLRTLIAPSAVALLIGILAVSTLNPIVSVTSTYAERLSDLLKTGQTSALSISDTGLWFRQSGTDGQTVIYASRYDANLNTYFGVTFLTYEKEGRPIRRIEAESAKLIDGGWSLTNTKSWFLQATLNPENTAIESKTRHLPSTLTQEQIRETLGNPRGISIWNLPRTIQQLSHAGFSTQRHEIWLQSELSRPLFFLSMVLIASAFTMRPTRLSGSAKAILLTLLIGFGLYFIRNFALVLGENAQLPILLAAWAPSVAAMLLAIGLLLHTEDG